MIEFFCLQEDGEHLLFVSATNNANDTEEHREYEYRQILI